MAEDKVQEAPEGEAPEGEEGGGAKPKKKLSMKLMLIAGAGALVVLGGGGAGAFFMLKPKPEAASGKDAKKKSSAKKGKDDKGKKDDKTAMVREGPDGVLFYTIPDVVVNMQTADGRPTFLKLKLTLELPDQATVDELEPNMPRLQDMFQTFLRELRPEDLSGSQGSYQLRMEILRRVNLVIAPSKANAVLIEEMLIN
ncbi:MAG TPA: flagellar basal body-associated FliL family protein [Phenylobacterium sp.]|uniref:flagellar basal body-associated FliL family protein n=1 Tax=Phenylobacterium sp. TaxID=1871053 RepID=UPI002CAE937E|nr:flagellar basal body-associated FliL family protein [Phenylobacterium sp.]HXA39218.1 flagellar basal body-associated FliL family protein [Phenylobacterium sp.]